MERKYTEKIKIPGISYAFTIDGVELPVLDVTHPLFISSIDELKLQKMISEIGNETAERAKKFYSLPSFVKKYLAKRSYIMAGFMEMDSGNTYVSGLSTMMMKLGPGLIGKGRKKFLDRLGSKASGGMMVRMRARDMATLLAESVIRSVKRNPGKDLCMFNIGGGTATDSINSLIIIHRSEPLLLRNIKIEIDILDIDDFGPWFAAQSVQALTSEGGALNGIELECRYYKYDWNDTALLSTLVKERKECIQVCSSEGGLFEYGEEIHILENLRAISENDQKETFITGSVLKDPLSIDPIIMATLSMTSITPKMYGIEVLKQMAIESGWKLDNIASGNPRYVVFTLSKS
jgi:hypothetical protein